MNNSKMNNADEAVERVLAGLRAVEPLPGMEERILLAAERADGSLASSLAAFWGTVWLRPVWARAFVFSAVALMVTLIGVGLHGRWVKNRDLRLPAQTMDSHRTTTTEHSSQVQQPTQIRAALKAKLKSPLRHRVNGIPPMEALARGGARAPSHPAPTPQLTEQERLLLRVVHAGDPRVMAMLNPEVQAKEEERSHAEFEAFVNLGSQGDRE